MCEYSKKYSEYIQLLKEALSSKRFVHSMNVAQMCLRLARTHGADEEKAYLAGLLHDIKKEETPHAMKSLMVLSNMDIGEEELNSPPLWHGPAGAYYISAKLGITDSDILAAVRYHTAGNDNMTPLQKIVYLGDLVSEDRGYKDVEKYRKMSFDDLDNAMYHALRFSVGETLGKGGLIPACTWRAYNFYTCVYRKAKDESERKQK